MQCRRHEIAVQKTTFGEYFDNIAYSNSGRRDLIKKAVLDNSNNNNSSSSSSSCSASGSAAGNYSNHKLLLLHSDDEDDQQQQQQQQDMNSSPRGSLNNYLMSCFSRPVIDAIRYLTGAPGPTGFGSITTAEQVTHEAAKYSHHLINSLTAIITGATSGIGAETARVLAKRGVRLILPARNVKAAEETRNRIQKEMPSAEILVMPLDLSSLASVRSFVSHFLQLDFPLNILINNAGKFCHHHAVSEDGIEMTFATNHLGHFLLTKLLLGKMIETAETCGIQGRIVNVSSNIHSWFMGDRISYEELLPPLTTTQHKKSSRSNVYDPTRAYALSKLANILHSKELAKRLQDVRANVTVNSVHPGIVRTRLTREREGFITDVVFLLASKLLKTIPQAASTTCFVATHPRVSGISGSYFSDCNEAPTSKLGTSEDEAARLWKISEDLIN